jgi:hypothetical protein
MRLIQRGELAERLRSGLQIREDRFDSDTRLHVSRFQWLDPVPQWARKPCCTNPSHPARDPAGLPLQLLMLESI